MPRPTVNAVMDQETLYWIPDPLRDQALEADVDVWQVYFKIDGTTASVSDAPDNKGKLVGTATTSGTRRRPAARDRRDVRRRSCASCTGRRVRAPRCCTTISASSRTRGR